jgi:hypothetical protein
MSRKIGQLQDESSTTFIYKKKKKLAVTLRYIRRKGINISSATPQAKLTGEFIDLETLEPIRKS